MKFVMFIIIFLLIGAFFIISENNLALNNPGARHELGNLYTLWLGKLFDNSKNLVGYVVKMEWLPDKNDGVEIYEE